jgi:hypothetical protein
VRQACSKALRFRRRSDRSPRRIVEVGGTVVPYRHDALLVVTLALVIGLMMLVFRSGNRP